MATVRGIKVEAREIKTGDIIEYRDYRGTQLCEVVAVPGEDFNGRSVGGRMDSHWCLRTIERHSSYFEHEWMPNDKVVSHTAQSEALDCVHCGIPFRLHADPGNPCKTFIKKHESWIVSISFENGVTIHTVAFNIGELGSVIADVHLDNMEYGDIIKIEAV